MINVVMATDEKFVQHCAVAITSLLINHNAREAVTFYILCDDISKIRKNSLQKNIKKFNAELVFLEINKDKLIDLPMPDLKELKHISIATYYRLFMVDLLPLSVERIIYLDCDVIVRRDISDLWEIDLNDKILGAVFQLVNRTVTDIIRLGYPVRNGYFNAGILLINLKAWRNELITEKVFNFIFQNSNKIKYHDQDVLNAILNESVMQISPSYNLLPDFIPLINFPHKDILNGVVVNDYDEYNRELPIIVKDPHIIHFASHPKPWDGLCVSPFKNEYYKYLKNTEWNEFKEPYALIFPFYKVTRIFYMALKKIFLLKWLQKSKLAKN